MSVRALSLVAAVTIAVGGVVDAHAQSAVTQQKLNVVTQRNNASFFGVGQIKNQVLARALPRTRFYTTSAGLLNSPGSPAPQKPFANASRSTPLSPYMNLGGLPTGVLPNYYSNVRPQLQQQRANQQQQRANERLRAAQVRQQQELQAQAARSPYSYPSRLAGATDLIPTGHQTTFLNTLNYYPVGRRR